MLPSIEQVDYPGRPFGRARASLRTHAHRLREISLQAMVEGSARARLGRTLNARATMAVQQLNLQVGEE
eukprot:8287448-Lingulodinium_polyedra.AAC.1